MVRGWFEKNCLWLVESARLWFDCSYFVSGVSKRVDLGSDTQEHIEHG